VLDERLKAARAPDRFVELFDFVMGQFPPGWANRGPVLQAVEEDFDLAKGKAHIAGEADEEYAGHNISGISALAPNPVRNREKAAFFVVADGGGVEAGVAGKLSNLHFFPSCRQ
jgi:hypothetical protein